MTKDFQKELKEKVKEGVKPSDLKKLRKSKSLGDIPHPSVSNVLLKKSQSQLVIPLPNEPTLTQQISSLQDELTTERKRVSSLREDLNNSQDKNKQLKAQISQLEDKILELRLEKIKEFSDYYEQKKALGGELEENITVGIQEIQRLENKLLATNKKKLELAQKLGTTQSKNAQLELKLLNNQPAPNANWWSDYRLIILVASLYCLSAWLLHHPQEKHYG